MLNFAILLKSIPKYVHKEYSLETFEFALTSEGEGLLRTDLLMYKMVKHSKKCIKI